MTSQRLRLTASLLLLLAASATDARGDAASEAREHYRSATAHFAVGEFDKAAAEYQAAYMLKQDPALLFNAAQSYRLANQPERALILYKNYLQLFPDEPNADEVRAQILRLKEAIAARDRSTPQPPTETTQPSTVGPTPPAAPQPEASHPPQAAAASVPRKNETPAYKKWWVWTIVGVVVAGGAVTTAVLLTRPSGNSWSNAPDVGPGSSNALVRW